MQRGNRRLAADEEETREGVCREKVVRSKIGAEIVVTRATGRRRKKERQKQKETRSDAPSLRRSWPCSLPERHIIVWPRWPRSLVLVEDGVEGVSVDAKKEESVERKKTRRPAPSVPEEREAREVEPTAWCT